MRGSPLITIFGPTAVGKTAIAVELATLLRGRGLEPIAISADALAVYREIPILTGAPTADERRQLEHRLVGVRSVTEEFSAGEFAALAHAEIDSAIGEGRTPILVGGTGLYLRAAVSDLDLRGPVAPEVRQRRQAQLEERGSADLHSELQRLDSDAAGRIDPADGRRVTRALELIDSGQTPPAPSGGLWDKQPRVPTIAIGLLRDPAEHRRRVDSRAEAMIRNGGAAEAEAAQRVGPSSTARAAIGWDELLAGDAEALKTRTWQLVRRQRTWMRRMTDVEVLDITGMDDRAAAVAVFDALGRRAGGALHS